MSDCIIQQVIQAIYFPVKMLSPMMLFSKAQFLLLCILPVMVGLIVKEKSKYWDFEFPTLDLNNHHFNLCSIISKVGM